MHINFLSQSDFAKKKIRLLLLNSKIAFHAVCCGFSKKKNTAKNSWHVSCTVIVNWNSMTISNCYTPDGTKLLWITGFLLVKP